MRCPRCGSEYVQVQAVSEIRKRSCLTVLLYIILLFVPVIGWIALFLLLRGKNPKPAPTPSAKPVGHIGGYRRRLPLKALAVARCCCGRIQGGLP